MENKKDIKPILNWAVENGEAKIVDRISMKLLPHFLKHNLKLTEDIINSSSVFKVPVELYDLVKSMAEELVSSSYVE